VALCHPSGAVPTYDYQCRSCGAVTEVIHSMREDGPSVCERCGGELRRVLYPTGIIFKGSGFYRTDSRKASAANDGATPPSSGAASEKASGPDTTPGSTAPKPSGETSAAGD
jgi:putative FmdB family regulatory protein